MTQWAILSGIQGNLTAYEAVRRYCAMKFGRRNLRSSAMWWDQPQTAKIGAKTAFPHRNEIKPMICKGWWKNNI